MRTAALDLAPPDPGQRRRARRRPHAHLGVGIDHPVLGPEYLRKLPLGRFGEPADVANTVAYLASEQSSYITGQTLILDGGLTLGQPLEAMDITIPGAGSDPRVRGCNRRQSVT